jgi:endonuclease/exonuclease/phosphatase family metal-dependent hydrolase
MNILDRGLRAFQPDLICLQEVSMISGEPQVDSILRSLEFKYRYYGTGIWEGRDEGLILAWKSDWDLIDSTFINLPHRDPDMSRGIAAARLSLDDKDVLIATTHLAYRICDRDLRVAQAESAVTHLYSEYECYLDRLILCGDLNDTPSSGISQIFAERLALYDAQGRVGMGDEVTFSSHNFYVDPELVPDRRIDYVMPSNSIPLSGFKLALNSPDALASDHYALISDLVI